MPMYITLAELLQFSLVVIGIIGLFVAIKKK
nr:MAG TPA: Putative Holin-like Toxin (Hol-Tox) [Caudoviricetes sp.]